MSGSGDLTGTANHVPSHHVQQQPQQQQPHMQQQQQQQHLESVNGESIGPGGQHLSRYIDELPAYSYQYRSDAYAPGIKYAAPRSCSGSPWEQRPERFRGPELHKASYRCEENLQRYPQRCKDEYQHRCSESNLMAERYAESVQHKYWADVNKYLQRYSEEPLRKTCDDVSHYPSPSTTTDLRKFPQTYSEDPLRVPQPSVKYVPPGLRCPDHHSSGSFKYPKTSAGAGFFANRILSPGGLPMIGQTAIGLVVNKFGSGPLDHHHLHRDEHQHFAHHPYSEQSGFCPCDTGPSTARDEDDYLDGRYMMNTSMSDSDDI